MERREWLRERDELLQKIADLQAEVEKGRPKARGPEIVDYGEHGKTAGERPHVLRVDAPGETIAVERLPRRHRQADQDEIKAITSCLIALAPLSRRAQLRAFSYLRDRLGEDAVRASLDEEEQAAPADEYCPTCAQLEIGGNGFDRVCPDGHTWRVE